MTRLSIIMATYNSAQTIGRAIDSFLLQNFEDKELIVVDGLSTDQTCDIVKSYANPQIILRSEADRGIYDALNKGIARASGGIIGILHSNDHYPHENVLQQAEQAINSENLSAVFADVEFFNAGSDKAVRRYSSKRFAPNMLKYGLMPAHPTLFLRRTVFDNFGFYRTDMKIAADFDFVARIFKAENFTWRYIPTVWMNMQLGGASTSGVKSTIRLNQEIMIACKSNGIKTSWAHLFARYSWKIFEMAPLRKVFRLA